MSQSRQDFWLLCFLQCVQYCFYLQWHLFFQEMHLSQVQDLSHLPLCTLGFIHNSHRVSLIYNLQVNSTAWQLEHFGLSQLSLSLPLGQRPCSSKTFYIFFWICVGDWSEAELGFQKNIFCGTICPSVLMYHPFCRNFYCPPVPLFILSTWKASKAKTEWLVALSNKNNSW